MAVTQERIRGRTLFGIVLGEPRIFFLWCGNLASTAGVWMISVASVAYLIDLKASPLMVGAIQTALTAPVLFLVIGGGILADRFIGRLYFPLLYFFLFLSGVALSVCVALFAIREQTWLLALAAIGSLNALVMPAWQSMISGLVPPSEIPTVAALHSVGANLGKSGGSWIAAALIPLLGIAVTVSTASLLFAAMGFVVLRGRKFNSVFAAPPVQVNVHSSAIPPSILVLAFCSFWIALSASSVWTLLPIALSASGLASSDTIGFYFGIVGIGALFGLVVLHDFFLRFTSAMRISVLCVALSISILVMPLGGLGYEFGLLGQGASWSLLGSTLNAEGLRFASAASRGKAAAVHMFGTYSAFSIGGVGWGASAQYLTTSTCFIIAAIIPLIVAIALPPLLSISFRRSYVRPHQS